MQRLFSLAGLAPGTSFKRVDDQFPVCFKFSGKKFYALSQSWTCLKLLVFFKALAFCFIFLEQDYERAGTGEAAWLCH